MTLDPGASVFQVGEVAWAIFCRDRLLATWLDRQVYELGENSPGRGHNRMLSAHDAVQLAIMVAMYRFGVSPRQARKVAAEVTVDFRDRGVNREDHTLLIQPYGSDPTGGPRKGDGDYFRVVEYLMDPGGEELAGNLGGREVWCTEVGAVLGAHVGPGMVAVCVAPRVT